MTQLEAVEVMAARFGAERGCVPSVKRRDGVVTVALMDAETNAVRAAVQFAEGSLPGDDAALRVEVESALTAAWTDTAPRAEPGAPRTVAAPAVQAGQARPGLTRSEVVALLRALRTAARNPTLDSAIDKLWEVVE